MTACVTTAVVLSIPALEAATTSTLAFFSGGWDKLAKGIFTSICCRSFSAEAAAAAADTVCGAAAAASLTFLRNRLGRKEEEEEVLPGVVDKWD